jgi:hypothetical protein
LLVGRVIAGLQLALIVAFWLAAWIPLAIYAGLVVAAAPLRRSKLQAT